MSRLIVALPAYNEEECLPPLLDAFATLFSQLPATANPLVIVVDDGSKDRTADVVREYEKKMPALLVPHPKNKGLGEAIKTGLRAALEHATGPDDVIVCMDADNTHPPQAVHKMLELIEKEHIDIVIASRYRKGSEQHGVPPHRQFMSLGARFLFWLFLRLDGVRDYTCGFRAYRAELVRKAFDKYGDKIIQRNGFACTDELLVNLACIGDVKIREIPFILRYDLKVGASKLNLGLTLKETFKLLNEGRNQLKQHRRRS